MKVPFGVFEQDNRTLALNTLMKEFSSAVVNGLGGQSAKIPLRTDASQNESETAPFIYILEPGGWKRLNIDIFED